MGNKFILLFPIRPVICLFYCLRFITLFLNVSFFAFKLRKVFSTLILENIFYTF